MTAHRHQMPLQPLFSPVYSSTRSYSQTKSNTQRDLMQYDEVLRLEPERCIALFNHRKPALLYKLAPEELPGFNDLKPCRIVNYKPEWKRREEAAARKRGKKAKQEAKPPQAHPPEAQPPAQAKEEKKTQPSKNKPRSKPIPADDPPPAIPDYSGIEMVPMSAVLGAEGEDDSDDLPKR